MRQAIALVVAVACVFLAIEEWAGLRIAADLGFAATAVIVVTNMLTFAWLWWVRATPLALGMALSWFGQIGLSIYWYVMVVPDFPGPIFGDRSYVLFAAIAFYLVGGAFHIGVIQRSLGASSRLSLWVTAAALTVAGTFFIV